MPALTVTPSPAPNVVTATNSPLLIRCRSGLASGPTTAVSAAHSNWRADRLVASAQDVDAHVAGWDAVDKRDLAEPTAQ